MYTIAKANMFFRAQPELPAILGLRVDEFRDGWSLVRKASADQLRRRTRKHGWALVRDFGQLQASGVGDTAQLAIACALKLALRNANKRCDAAEVEHIGMTQYPWFYLARVRAYPYRIQQVDDLPVCGKTGNCPELSPQSRTSPSAPDLLFGCSMSQLKQLLVISQGTERGVQ
jgi:hypothetical protein